jgi:hypothetical protein
MPELKNQIRHLLAQDVMLEPAFKNKVLKNIDQLKQKQLGAILKTLQILVDQEQQILANSLEKKPYLFNEIQHKILEIMHQEFEKSENITHKKAEIELVHNLKNFQS